MEELHKNNNDAERLQEELTMRGKYYFKCFGNLLQGLAADLENFSNEAMPEDESHAREMLRFIISLYQSIPFEQITNHPDYNLLLEIKEEISRLVPEVESVLNNKNNIKKSYEIIKIIEKKGAEYRKRLKTLLEQIRLQPGHEQDGFKVVDIHGKTWNNAI